METNDYLLESFKNIQDLIKFTDQKVGAVLIVCGIQISVFMEKSKSITFLLSEIEILNIIVFLLGLSFFILLLITFYLSIFKILKPSFAKNYSSDAYSIFYFEHIALNDKNSLEEAIHMLNGKKMTSELKDQIYEISKILHRKNKACASVMKLLFFSIFCLTGFILLTRFI